MAIQRRNPTVCRVRGRVQKSRKRFQDVLGEALKGGAFMAKLAICGWTGEHLGCGRLSKQVAWTAPFLLLLSGIGSIHAQNSPCSTIEHQADAVFGAPSIVRSQMIHKPCQGINLRSLDRDRRTGVMLARNIDANNKLIVDPEVMNYLYRLEQTLVESSQVRMYYPVTIKVLESSRIDAFVLPGGYIYLSSGLILAMNTESELAGILAHETAHIAGDHDRHLQKGRRIWSIAAYCSGPGALAVQFTGFLFSMKTTRDTEREADFIAIRYLEAAGYSPEAFVQFLEMPQWQNDQSYNVMANLFATHPATAERIKLAKTEISMFRQTEAPHRIMSQEFEQMKTWLSTLVESPQASRNLPNSTESTTVAHD